MGPKTEQPVNLDGLFGHLSASNGLYSRETFLNLYSCIVRIIRQYHLKGQVFYRVLDDPDFLTVGMALEGLRDVQTHVIDDAVMARCDTFRHETTGFIVVLTNQFCAAVHWSNHSQEAYGMFDGGWTYHPGDSKTIALEIASYLDNSETLIEQIEATPLDRRYDEKNTWFITQLVNNLETRNRELTLALNQVKELNAKVLDQERLAAIGQLCSVIAHEIRNPLGLINLYAKLIEKQVEQLTLEEPQQVPLEKNLQLIRGATDSLEGILSELTSYARPLELELESTDVRELAMEVVDMFASKYEEQNVQLTWEFPKEPIVQNVDRRRLKQALINLVKNALEASKPEMAVNVTLASRPSDNRLLLTVEDQGSGVDERSQKKLFTPYFSTKGNGTGLGLAHSRKILQAHGGTVALLSTGETGSVFALILPLHGKSGVKPGSSPKSAGNE